MAITNRQDSRTTLPELHSEEHLRESAEEFNLDNVPSVEEEDVQKTDSAGTTFTWAVTLFGTAVGAGILFLPISAGSFGFWPLLIATIFIGPLVFCSHRIYARMVSDSPVKGLDVLQVVTALTGRKRGFLTAVLYWLTIYPTVVIYGISMTNTIDSFIVNQLGGPSINRWVLATACVTIMMAGLAFGKKIVLYVSNLLVYPLIIALAAVSFYLVPQWDIGSFFQYKSDFSVVKSLFLILPVLVFSFSHMAALSQFALDAQRTTNGDVKATEKLVTKVEGVTTVMLVAFTMFFVWSCTLALGADGMDAALEANIPILSYFANVTNTPIMALLAPVVTICAIASSFFGHMLGTEEGSKYIFCVIAPGPAERLRGKKLTYLIYAALLVLTILVAVANPSILDLISVVGGIFVAFFVYMLPMLLFRKAKAFKHYANRPSTIIIFFIGLIIAAVTVYELITG